MNGAHCRGCGAAIVWVRTASGGRMPLDALPEKRIVLEGDEPVARVVDTYVSHFATCPEAAKFRKPKEPTG